VGNVWELFGNCLGNVWEFGGGKLRGGNEKKRATPQRCSLKK